MKEKITKIKIENIESFKNHPFSVNNDDSLMELAKSIKENGLLNPLIVSVNFNDIITNNLKIKLI